MTDVSTAATFTNVNNWQGVDDEPTAGSDNLVKSGGIYQSLGFNDVEINPKNLMYQSWGNTALSDVTSNIMGKLELIKKVEFNIVNQNVNTFGLNFAPTGKINIGDIINFAVCIYTEDDIKRKYTLNEYSSGFSGTFTLLTPKILSVKKGFNYFMFAMRSNFTQTITNTPYYQLFFKDNSLDGKIWYCKSYYYIGTPGKKVIGKELKDYIGVVQTELLARIVSCEKQIQDSIDRINSFQYKPSDIYFMKEGTNVGVIEPDENGEYIVEVSQAEVSSTRNINGIYLKVEYTHEQFEDAKTIYKLNWTDYLNGSQLKDYGFSGILYEVGVWGTSDKGPVAVDFSALTGNGINIFEILKNSSKAEQYAGRTYCYICVAAFIPVESKLPYKVGIKPYVEIRQVNIPTFEEINELIDEKIEPLLPPSKYIACWGDSLTAQGGWTTRLQELSEMTLYNFGVGGEGSATICARQGGDAIQINNVTIPSGTTKVQINSAAGAPLRTQLGRNSSPLIQGQPYVNNVLVNGILMNFSVELTSSADKKYYLNQLSEDSVQMNIDRPTDIITRADREFNKPYLIVIFMGQNGGYTDVSDLINQHRKMLEHAKYEHFLILGLSSGTASSREDYENAMKAEFGRYFISLREYLSTPIYENNSIVSCYGMADQNVAVDPNFVYDGKTTIQEIELGMTPHQILADSTHFTTGTKTVIGNMIYKKCIELGIFTI